MGAKKVQSESECFVSEAIMGDAENSVKTQREKNDEIQLVDTFPEEVWEIILNKVSQQHYEAVINSSPFFRRLLSPTRVCFLFARVWKIIGLKYEDSSSDPVYKCTTLNIRRTKLNAVPLRLRQVCKDWCCGIDAFYECFFDPSSPGYSTLSKNGRHHFPNSDSWMHWIKAVFCSPQAVAKALSHFQPTHETSGRNPFPGRNITIYKYFGDQQDDLIELLTIYGHQFWFCEITFPTHDHSGVEPFRLRLRECLRLMPNLKVLSLQSDQYGKREEAVSSPRFEKLMDLELPNLNSLTVTFEVLEDFLMLEDCGKSWPLKNLNLKFGQDFPYIRESRVFTFLEQWRETLTDLKLRLTGVEKEEEKETEIVSDVGSMRNLPFLKKLMITM